MKHSLNKPLRTLVLVGAWIFWTPIYALTAAALVMVPLHFLKGVWQFVDGLFNGYNPL